MNAAPKTNRPSEMTAANVRISRPYPTDGRDARGLRRAAGAFLDEAAFFSFECRHPPDPPHQSELQNEPSTRRRAGRYAPQGEAVQVVGGWVSEGGNPMTRPVVFTCSSRDKELVAKETKG